MIKNLTKEELLHLISNPSKTFIKQNKNEILHTISNTEIEKIRKYHDLDNNGIVKLLLKLEYYNNTIFDYVCINNVPVNKECLNKKITIDHIKKYLNNDIINYIFKKFPEDYLDVLRYIFKKTSQENLTIDYIEKNILISKKTNNPLVWSRKYFSFYHSETDRTILKGHTKGTKRPEIGLKIGNTLRGKSKSKEHREKMNNRLKSIDFKKNILIKNNIILDYNNEEEIKKQYSIYTSNRNKLPIHRINKIKKFLKSKKYLNEIIYMNFFEKYNEIEINEDNYLEIFTEMGSIISTISIRDSETMGNTKFFKRGIIEVKFCRNKTLLKYRSSWELTTIEFLEKNEISYEYESFFILKKDGSHYIPDFLIYLNNKTVLLEIKGFIRGKKGKEKEALKQEAAIEYCKENNLEYIYLLKPLTDINQLN